MKEMTITSAQYVKDPESSENMSIKATINGVEVLYLLMLITYTMQK